MLRIDLLRHGETKLGHTLRGSTDDQLTTLGWSQMQQSIDQSLAYQSWELIFTSPLKRCKDFAFKAASQLQLPIYIEHDLQEMHFGDWEATSTQEIYEKMPDLLTNFWQEPTKFTPPNAESMQFFHSRVLNALVNMQQQMNRQQCQHALVVTHAGIIKLLKCIALRQPLDDILKMSADLANLNCFKLDKNNLNIQFIENVKK